MSTVKELLNKLKGVNINSLTKLVIKENEKEIIQVNQQELSQGRNFLGQSVGLYSKTTELLSKDTNPRRPKKAGQPYNFEDTGDLFDGMFLKLTGVKLKIDSKGKGDQDKKLFISQNELLGFDDKSEEIINYEIIKPDLQKKFKNITKL
tara:strand:+ start:43 stop:489 length:447 start_codon:yes stop_codon:yes gene_type:complete